MAKIYARLVKQDLKAIEDVPENLREEVKRLIAEGIV